MSQKLTRVKPHTPTSLVLTYTYLSSTARQVFGKQVKGISITLYCFTPEVPSNQTSWRQTG